MINQMLSTQHEACLRLFKAFIPQTNEVTNSENIEQGLKYGIVFKSLFVTEEIIKIGISLYGRDPKQLNSTFHKSFATVRDLPIETLVIQQIVHYITTYGFEQLGIYSEDTVYIPNEKLEIPELNTNDGTTFTVIKEMTEEQLKESLMTLLTSGIALSKQTIEDILTLSGYIDKDRFADIKNKEVLIALYDKYGIVPEQNTDFLKYLVYKLTDNTLLIKDRETEQCLKDLDKPKYRMAHILLTNYVSTHGYIRLARIFNRYKSIFISLKRESTDPQYIKDMNKIINRISKLSKKYHLPMKANILDELTSIPDLRYLDACKDEILEELDKVTVFREVRILNALKFNSLCTKDTTKVYKIRNGKGWVGKTKVVMEPTVQKTLYDLIYKHLLTRLGNSLVDKTVYIPKDINYTVPTSEKQFVGNVPEGSYIEIPRDSDLVIGVHWFDLQDKTNSSLSNRVDLDLHAANRGEQYGWNSSYRSINSHLYYSGDVTSAPEPNGATELFYIGKNCGTKSFLLTLNDYTCHTHSEVPFEFVIARADTTDIDKNYVINPNNIIIKFNMTIPEDINQINLGLVKVSDTLKFYLNDFSLGTSIVTSRNEVTMGAKDYLDNYSKVQLTLRELLLDANVAVTDMCTVVKKQYFELLEQSEGGKQTIEPIEANRVKELIDSGNGHLVLSKDIQTVPDIDLSLNTINKETIIKLLCGGN